VLHLDAPAGTFFHRGYRIAVGYALAAVLMFVIDAMRKKRSGFEDIAVVLHGGPASSESPSALPI